MDFAAVEEVEDLHHYEGVEDEGEMSGLDVSGVVDSLIVAVTRDGDESARADSASNDTVFPLPLRVSRKVFGVVTIRVLRYKVLSPENEDT